jgi:predicted transcriptional regulator
MALRKSATKTEARERARRAAAESMAREQRLLQLGEEFFLAAGEAEQILAAAEQRIRQIRTKAEQDAAQAREAQARVAAAMQGEQVAVSEIAQRLELSAAEVRTLLKEHPPRASADAADESLDGDPAAHDAVEAAALEAVSV